MNLQLIEHHFSICKTENLCAADIAIPFCFTAITDEECSIVCPDQYVPDNCLIKEAGWRALRIEGVLDFTLVGILARIAVLLADAGIPIFAVSTYNTDYIFLKQNRLLEAISLLEGKGYRVSSSSKSI